MNETDISMWIFGRIQTIERLCLELTDFRLSQLHSSTVGADRQQTSREKSATEHRIRTGRHEHLRHDIVTTRHETTEIALGGSYQGNRDEIFDAEPEVTRGSHVEEEH